MSIKGNWKKTSRNAGDVIYPETIQFKANNLYEARAAEGAVRHPVWDVGTYAVEGDTLKMSTYTDAVISYAFRLEGRVLQITDATGCVLQYERV